MGKIRFAALSISMALASTAMAQQPGWGTQPTQPTQPGWGTQPTQPTQPAQTGWGTQPAQPTQPVPPPPPPPAVPPPPPPPLENGNVALGISNHFAPLVNTTSVLAMTIETVEPTTPGDTAAMVYSAYFANISFRYRLNTSHEIEAMLGMAYLNLTHQAWDDPLDPIAPEEISMGGFTFQLSGRYLFTIAGNERARLYTGAGLGFIIGTATGDADDADHTHGSVDWLGWGITVGAPIGFEYRFEAAPQLALTMEVGVALAYVSGTTTQNPPTGSGAPSTEDTGGQFIFGMGQSANLSDYIYIPILDHLSFGLHYWF